MIFWQKHYRYWYMKMATYVKKNRFYSRLWADVFNYNFLYYTYTPNILCEHFFAKKNLILL